jgi:hypothetical protein
MTQINGIYRLPENDWESVGRAFLHTPILADNCRVEEVVNSAGEHRLADLRRQVELAVNYPELYVMSPVGAELMPVEKTSHYSPAQMKHLLHNTFGTALFENEHLHYRSSGERVGEEIRVLHHTKVAYPPYKEDNRPEVETTPFGSGDIIHTGSNARGSNRAVRWVKFEGKVYFFSNASAMLSPLMLQRIDKVNEYDYADHKHEVTDNYKALANWVNRFKHMAALVEDFPRMKLNHSEIMLEAMKSCQTAAWYPKEDRLSSRFLKWMKHDGTIYVYNDETVVVRSSEIAVLMDALDNAQTMSVARGTCHDIFQRCRGSEQERHSPSKRFKANCMVYA